MDLDRSFAAVIFDLDGTLVDSRQALYDAWSQWAEEEGISAEQLADWHGHPTKAIVEQLVPAGRADASLQRIDALELQTAGTCVALPGAFDAVLLATAVGRAAIATSGTREVAAARLRAAGIPAPKVFVSVSDVGRGKPDPAIFLEAARQLGAEPQDCLVCEDAVAGVEAARAAGCAVLAVTTTTPAERLHADRVVENLAAVEFAARSDGIRVRPAPGRDAL